jgi:acyl carrier protein
MDETAQYTSFMLTSDAVTAALSGVDRRSAGMGLSPSQVRERVRAFVTESGVATTDDDTEDLFASGFADSVFAHQLVIHLETEFNFVLESDDLDIHNFRSVDMICEFVGTKLGAGVR